MVTQRQLGDTRSMSIIRPPEIATAGATWLNTSRPLSLRELRGKLVVLDFWTLGCINCVHVIPTLRRVERAFPEDVVVIGIHSPKFTAEQDPERVGQAVSRLGITHPVLLDNDMRLWEEYAVSGWPTLVIIEPTGRIGRVIRGEPDPDGFFRYMEGAVEGWGEMGLLTGAAPLGAPPEAERPAPGAGFSFPARLDFAAGRLFVADSGNNQVALCLADGTVLQRIGGGSQGFVDGEPGEALFDRPEGIAVDDSYLYVADTGNHAIRAVSLDDYTVSTLAGAGERGGLLPFGPSFSVELASPADLAIHGSSLYFSNSGTHQLGVLDLTSGQVRAVAGQGAENMVDGPAARALLAQPTGMSLDREKGLLYFLDSESSAVRCLQLTGEPTVHILAGKGLFTWGAADGPLREALLQHPHDLVHRGHTLYVADSYNDTIRELDLQEGTANDLLADFTCLDPVYRPLAEPGGLAWASSDTLIVSDTNNHRLLRLDLEARTWQTLRGRPGQESAGPWSAW